MSTSTTLTLRGPAKPALAKWASLAAMPLWFVAAFVAAFLAMSAADAFAQGESQLPPVEQGSGGMPEYGYAPPSDEVPPTQGAETNAHGDAAHGDAAHGDAAHGDAKHAGHGDPTKHFNYLDGGGGLFGYQGKDAYGGKLGDGKMTDPHTGEVVNHEEAMSPPFIFMVLNFLILMGLLVWKGRPAVRKMAAERHDQIKSALDEAAQLREKAAAKLEEYEAKLEKSDEEIKALVEGIRKDAEADKLRILENAENQAAQMKKDADSRIAAEIEYARAALTREVTDAATAATEKLLREKMMPGDQSKLVGSFITDIGQSVPVPVRPSTKGSI